MPFNMMGIGQAAQGMMGQQNVKNQYQQKPQPQMGGQGIGPSMGMMGQAIGRKMQKQRPQMGMNQKQGRQMGGAIGQMDNALANYGQQRQMGGQGQSLYGNLGQAASQGYNPQMYQQQQPVQGLNPDQSVSFGTADQVATEGIGPQPQMMQNLMKQKKGLPQMGSQDMISY
jgi:hypothetical protein